MGAGSVLEVEGPSIFLVFPAMGPFAGLDNLFVDLADDDDDGGGGVEEVPFVRGLEVCGAEEA